jgi:hypothetical protein
MSKLSTHQIRAMVAKIEATIGSHEARPGTPSNVRKLEQSQARLASYRAELAEREGEQDAETDRAEQAAQAGPVIHLAPRHHPITPPAPVRAEPDDELANLCRSILQRWTLGTVIDQLWRSEAKLYGSLTQPRVTRAPKARTA